MMNRPHCGMMYQDVLERPAYLEIRVNPEDSSRYNEAEEAYVPEEKNKLGRLARKSVSPHADQSLHFGAGKSLEQGDCAANLKNNVEQSTIDWEKSLVQISFASMQIIEMPSSSNTSIIRTNQICHPPEGVWTWTA